jgi:DNA polymerase-1
MRYYNVDVLGHACRVKVVEDGADLLEFMGWVEAHQDEWVAVDTESTGLDLWSDSWRLRMVQFGTVREAWVLWLEGDLAEASFGAAEFALKGLRWQVAHNRPFDVTSLSRAGLPVHNLWLGRDTMIMAHLIDSRSKQDGGVGHSLKDLGAHWIDPSMKDGDEALKEWARAQKGIKVDDRYWAAPYGLPELERYSGLDVMITRGLHDLFEGRIAELGCETLLEFELEVQRECAEMASRGMLLDVEYAEALREFYLDREDVLLQKLDAAGVENPNSGAQIREALLAGGVKLTERTGSGEFSVAKEVLGSLDHPVAAMIMEYRHASKFRAAYVDSCLDIRDAGDRVHPGIRSLQARTARMAVSAPALQQLPSSDPLVRRMFIADEGMTMIACDYSQVELRVLAALASERKLLKAIADGVDLHTNTADQVGISRKLGKMVNFLVVYGGGVGALATQAGVSEDEAKAALNGFHRAFPGVRRYSNRLQEKSGKGVRPIVTPAGRRIHLDRDRSYAAVNYAVQSTARDVLAESLLELGESEFAEGLLLPVHDEFVAQAPAGEAQRWADGIAGIMARPFGETFLDADAEVYGPSWGHGYVADDLSNVPVELKGWF